MTARKPTHRPTTPTPTAPTPASPDLLAGLMVMASRSRAERTSRVGQSPVALAAPLPAATVTPAATPAATTRTRTGALPAGLPIVPANGGKLAVTELPVGQGWFWAMRVAHPTSASCVGDFRAFRPLAADILPSTEPGTRFESWHGNNRASCGTWEIRASKPETAASKPVRVNDLYPRPTAS